MCMERQRREQIACDVRASAFVKRPEMRLHRHGSFFNITGGSRRSWNLSFAVIAREIRDRAKEEPVCGKL